MKENLRRIIPGVYRRIDDDPEYSNLLKSRDHWKAQADTRLRQVHDYGQKAEYWEGRVKKAEDKAAGLGRALEATQQRLGRANRIIDALLERNEKP